MKIKQFAFIMLLFGALLTVASCKKDEVKQPVACFTASATTVSAGTAVTFDPSCSENAHHHEWDFGDGATSAEENPSHAFNNPGTYTVKLTVLVEDMSKMDETTQTITVN